MGHSDAEYIYMVFLLFAVIGFVTPYIALEFGGTIASFDVESVGEATGLGIFNAITSVFFWTFGVPTWLNIILFTPIRVMMWFILIRNTPFVGSGGS